MLALRLPADIEERLDALAKKTGRSKSYYAREASLRQIEDIEDYYLQRVPLEENRRVGKGAGACAGDVPTGGHGAQEPAFAHPTNAIHFHRDPL